MPRAIASLPARAEAQPAGDLSSCGFTDSLSSNFASGGIVLGHPGLVARKRSLDNMENIPPFGLDRSAPATSSGIEKSAVSLLDLAAVQLSQNQHKRRRAVITASSPGGQQRMASNPRRAVQPPDNSFLRSLASVAHNDKAQQLRAPGSVALFSAQSQKIHHPQLTPQHSISGGGAGATAAAASISLRRLPKRNLKPLDFSSLHQPSPHHSAKLATAACATAGTGANGKRTASSRPGAHSSGMGTNMVSLPVSPARTSPLAILPVGSLRLPTSSPPAALSRPASVISDASGTIHPTPPNTEPRRQSAFSGLLASAYQRASTKRSSKRALCFGSSSKVEDESLQEYDSVLGPRCPVIGVPGGLFETQRSGIDSLRREQNERGESIFSEMTRTVQQAQSEFEAAVAEQSTRGRPRGRQPKASGAATGGKTRGQPAAAGSGKGTASKRPISECKYCGKQYKYHAKLASHEQHCASRLEALLYSADEHEQHIIHCLCGPRHDRPVGERDDLPMVQCDNCLLWLHIECVGIDEDNLPEEFFCPRCDDAFDDRRGSSIGASAAPSTPKRRNAPRAASLMMSPESSRLATLLAGVPDAGADTDTDNESLTHRAKTKATSQRRRKTTGNCSEHDNGLSSDDTMSISMSEATRFHRRGGSVKGCKSPSIPRMAQSEAGVSPVHHRRRVRSGIDGTSQVVFTDAPSSDFLGLPLPETIFSEKPGLGTSTLVGGGALSIASGLCSQQTSMDDLTRFLSTSQPQWSLAQLSDMLGGSAPGTTASDMIGNCYIDQSLAEFGLGLGLGAGGSSVRQTTGTAAGRSGGNGGPGTVGFETAAAPLSELMDLPVDSEFSALLESIAGANGGTDADPYSSLGVGSSYGGLLSDDIMLELNSCMPISGPIGASAAAVSGGSGRLIGSRLSGGDVELGSSSTITLMHDTSSMCSQDNVGPAVTRIPRALPPAPARPPPGMPGMARGRSAGMGARAISRGTSSSQAAQSKSLGAPALSAAMSLSLPSNPPSTTGLVELDVRQLLLGVDSSQALDWPAEGDVLEMELEGLINFDA
ncbi:hypothetical protein GGI20_005225 [Coemansia sp. BCRC 34301]|nr:hypothetical protein GGI20_005225 [Coemansia sp. BCRC 34301]